MVSFPDYPEVWGRDSIVPRAAASRDIIAAARQLAMKTPLKLSVLLVLLAVATSGVISFLVLRLGATKLPMVHLTTHHPVLTYFRKRLRSGTYVDMNPQSPYRLVLPDILVDSRHVYGASLSAEPSEVHSGETVTVTWKDIPDPSKRAQYDWIGLYCPSGADTHSYIDYWLVNDSPTYWLGFGTAKFTLYNLRVDCEFRYHANNTYTELLAVANRVTFTDGAAAPLQGHLSLTGDPTEMRVQWTTGTSSTPTVFYGFSQDVLNLTAYGTSRTYKASDMCGPPANLSIYFWDPGYLHGVLLTGLLPNSLYYYQYGSEGVYSDVKTFRTSLRKGDHTPYTFIAYGDMDTTLSPGADLTALLVRKEVYNGASFVAHIGDISYAVGVGFRWDMWFSLIEPYSSVAPYMVAIGNHEQDHIVGGAKDPSHAPKEGFHPSWGNYGDDSGGECGVPMFNRFHMPDNGHALWWYSFDYGIVHYTIFSTEHNFTDGSPQHQWLEADLRAVDRTLTPWLIVMGHRAMYSSEKYPSDVRVGWHILEALEDMFYKYRVDMGLWGHYHAYERTCAVYRKQCNPRGTTHITVGTAGYSPLDSAGIYPTTWSRHFEVNFGYGRVMVANSSALLWEFVRNVDKSVSDSVWIHK